MAQHAVRNDTDATPRSTLLKAAVVGAAVVVACALGGAALLRGAATAAPASGAAAVETSTLPLSSTFTTVDAAPVDLDPGGSTDGIVVHPLRSTPVHDAPAGTAVARMDTEQFGDTWLPLIGERDGWVQVLLPSKPAARSGWIRADDVRRAATPYVVEIHLGSRTMELVRDGETVGEWSVTVGAVDTPTPTGRTFLLGAFSDRNQDYSPVFFPLGTHSPTLDSFGGGPGTVAIHGWPTDDGFGEALSSGCIRVPQEALDELTEVPLGTLVLIDQA